MRFSWRFSHYIFHQKGIDTYKNETKLIAGKNVKKPCWLVRDHHQQWGGRACHGLNTSLQVITRTSLKDRPQDPFLSGSRKPLTSLGHILQLEGKWNRSYWVLPDSRTDVSPSAACTINPLLQLTRIPTASVSMEYSDTNRPREVAAYCRVPQRPLPSLWVLKYRARKFAMQK